MQTQKFEYPPYVEILTSIFKNQQNKHSLTRFGLPEFSHQKRKDFFFIFLWDLSPDTRYITNPSTTINDHKKTFRMN